MISEPVSDHALETYLHELSPEQLRRLIREVFSDDSDVLFISGAPVDLSMRTEEFLAVLVRIYLWNSRYKEWCEEGLYNR